MITLTVILILLIAALYLIPLAVYLAIALIALPFVIIKAVFSIVFLIIKEVIANPERWFLMTSFIFSVSFGLSYFNFYLEGGMEGVIKSIKIAWFSTFVIIAWVGIILLSEAEDVTPTKKIMS